MKFNDHQLRLWNKMISLIDMYKEEKISFPELVESLQGTLDAGEFKDEKLINDWYEVWGPLEAFNAVKLDKNELVTKQEIVEEIKAMRNFLINSLKTNN